MRINRYIALATGLSRRAADTVIEDRQVEINQQLAVAGSIVNMDDNVTLNGKIVKLPQESTIIVLNKPVGYVCSRSGQGSKTIYELLPSKFQQLKPVGRLDKDSSGLLIMTNDGNLAHKLSHPSFAKEKVYEISLDKALSDSDRQHIIDGVELEDGLSKLQLRGGAKDWTVTMSEGRNRQIRRTFAALGYQVTRLHRVQVGVYNVKALAEGSYSLIA